MKKLFLILVVSVLFISCTEDIMMVENREKSTNIEVLNGIDSTYVVSFVGTDDVYLLQDGLVKFRLEQSTQESNGSLIRIKNWAFFLLIYGGATIIFILFITRPKKD